VAGCQLLPTVVTQHCAVQMGGRGGSGVPESIKKNPTQPLRSTAYGAVLRATMPLLHISLAHHVGRDTARTATLERAALFMATRPADFCRERAMVLLFGAWQGGWRLQRLSLISLSCCPLAGLHMAIRSTAHQNPAPYRERLSQAGQGTHKCCADWDHVVVLIWHDCLHAASTTDHDVATSGGQSLWHIRRAITYV
jgi:hypothetical protein